MKKLLNELMIIVVYPRLSLSAPMSLRLKIFGNTVEKHALQKITIVTTERVLRC